MTLTVISAIIAMIEQIIPLLGTSAATTTMITTIIDTLTKILPLIIDFVPTVYQSIKNIIAALSNDPSTTPAQWTALQALDAQVDTAFDAAAAAVDPDAPPATPLPGTAPTS